LETEEEYSKRRETSLDEFGKLPLRAILNIFMYLSFDERVSISLVSKSFKEWSWWNFNYHLIFSHPLLWESLDLQKKRMSSKQVAKILTTLPQMSNLKSLKLPCHFPIFFPNDLTKAISKLTNLQKVFSFNSHH